MVSKKKLNHNLLILFKKGYSLIIKKEMLTYNILKVLSKLKAQKLKEMILITIPFASVSYCDFRSYKGDAQNCHLCTNLYKLCEKKHLSETKKRLDKQLKV